MEVVSSVAVFLVKEILGIEMRRIENYLVSNGARKITVTNFFVRIFLIELASQG